MTSRSPMPTLGACLTLALLAGAPSGAQADRGNLEEALERLRLSRLSRNESPELGKDLPEDPRRAESNSQVRDLLDQFQDQKSRSGGIPPRDLGSDQAPEPAPGDAVEIEIPRRWDQLEVVLDSVPARLIEDLTALKTESFAFVGRRVERSITFLAGDEMKEDQRTEEDAVAFFLPQPCRHLYGVRLSVLSFLQGTQVRMDGKTPPIGRLRVFEVREVGDIRGQEIFFRDAIRFQLSGKETVIPIGIDTDPKRRLMIVLEIPGESDETTAISIPVATEQGVHPVKLLEPGRLLPKPMKTKFYDPSVKIEFQPDPSFLRPSAVIEGPFLDALRKYKRENPRATSFPLKVRLKRS